MTMTDLQVIAEHIPQEYDVPIYLATAEHCEMIPAECFGLFGPYLDVALRSWLESQNEWRGRGVP